MKVESLLLCTLHSPEIYTTNITFKICNLQNSLAVQWLGPCASTSGDPGSMPGQENKIPHATKRGQKKKKKKVIF